MLLLYSAFKDASGAVGVLAWCAVRKANLNDFVEKILESLDRRAGVSEDEAPFLTLRADHVLLSPGKNTPMKLYVAACESLPGGRAPGAVKAAVGENRWRPDLRLTEKEAGAVADDGAPSMVLGRSGTGKTVCMARRIARDRADHADRELLFVARSQALCNFVRDAACRGDADARAAGEPRAAAKFLTVNDLLPLLEEKTKNMAAGCKSDVRTPWRRMRYYRRVDGVDFRRDRDLRLTDEDYAKANGNYSSENDTDSSDDDSSDDDDGAGGARATQFGAMSFKVRGSCWPAADLVDFSRFRDEFWDKCGAERSRKNESLSPTFCWVQIQSFIKGSVTPLIRGEPLERDEYIDESGAISKRRATGLSKQDREDCYDVFVSYERELRHRQCANQPASKRDGGAMAILDHVYCDEVQDMTQATLAVLLLAVGNRPERLFVCGDTAQAIQDGVAFRFSDLKETIYELQKEVKTRSGRGAAAMAAASDRSGAAAASKKLFKLTNNYRTHAGILGAANAVLDLLEQAFPNSVDVMEKDAGVSTGPRPTFSHERPVLDDLPNATLLMRAEPLRDARRRLAAERDDRRALVEEREGAVGASDDRDAVLDRADAALKAAAADIADEAEEAAAAWHAEVKAARKAYDAETKRRDADAKKRRAKRDAWLADRDKQAKKAKADLAKLAKRARFEGADGDAGAGAAAGPGGSRSSRRASAEQGIVAGLVAEEVEADVLLGDMEEEDIADCIAPDPAAAQIRALIVRRGGARLLADPRALIGDYARALTPAAEASVAPLEHFVAVEQRANADRCAAEDFDAQEAALRSASSAPREPPADLDEPDLPALVKPTEDHSPAGRAAYKAEYVRPRRRPTPRSSAPTLPRSPRAGARKKASKAAERADAGAIDAEIRRRRAAAGLTPSALRCAELLDNKLVSTRVFSVQEFKGLEEEAVVLVDFFGSADKETAKAWRDLFKARREGRGDFSDLSRRRALERDLKLLYTALTRPRSRLVILELTKEGAASDAAKFFTAKPADGAAPLAEKHKRSTKEKKKSADGATLSADEWRSRGALIARVATERAEGDAGVSAGDLDARLGEARDCFRNAEDAELEHRCDAVIACAKAVKDVRAKVQGARAEDDVAVDDAAVGGARRRRRRRATAATATRSGRSAPSPKSRRGDRGVATSSMRRSPVPQSMSSSSIDASLARNGREGASPPGRRTAAAAKMSRSASVSVARRSAGADRSSVPAPKETSSSARRQASAKSDDRRASCRYCTTLQLEVLAACATLRRMCAEGPRRVAVLEALRAAPRALDTVLALLSSCPFVGPQAEDDAGEPDPAHPARRWERLARPVVCASRHLRRGEAPDGYAATPEQSTADFARCMLFGPVGLLNELASANHAVLGDVLASAWWPRACASLVRMTCFGLDDFMEDDYGDDDDDDPLGDVVGLTLSLLLMVAPRAPVRGAAPFESLRAALERDDVATDDFHACLLDWRDAEDAGASLTGAAEAARSAEPPPPDGYITAAADLLNLRTTGDLPEPQRLCLACCRPAKLRAAQESEIPNFKGSYLGRFPLAKLACSKCGAVFFCDNGNACQKPVWRRTGRLRAAEAGDAAASHPSRGVLLKLNFNVKHGLRRHDCMTSFDGARLELLGSAGAYDLITASRTALEAPVGWATAETLTYTHPAPTSVCGMMLESLGASTPVARGRSATTAWRFACGDAAARNEALVAAALLAEAGDDGGLAASNRGGYHSDRDALGRRRRASGSCARSSRRRSRRFPEGAGAAGDRPQLVQHQPRRQPQRAPRPSAGALLRRLLRGRARAGGGELAFQLDASAGCSAAAPGAGTCSYGVVEPADGVLVVFPGGLKHAVFPMRAGPRPRVSISFNVAPT
ncbi:manganese ion binding protein [Aureococcus anophagefferens]|nr:manganese ion binding protein [Aureococcus anophagefferens]